MFKLAPDFWTSKTTWISIAAIVGTIGAMIRHEVGLFAGFIVLAGEFQTMFMRDTISKKLSKVA